MAFNRKYFKLFKYLFPKSNTFSMFIQKKLTQLFEGLTALPDNYRKYIDQIYLDLFPVTTRELILWEKVFGIENISSDEAIRRNTIDQRWKLKGGQGPDYIQQTLQDNGFDVQVYENNPPIDPSIFIGGVFIMVAGGQNAYAGRADAFAGMTSNGELLVNGFIPIATSQRIFLVTAGNTYAGNQKAVAGYFEQFITADKQYILPTDPLLFPFVWFIGGDATRDPITHELTAIETVQIPAEREQEFKNIILTLKPIQTWVGLIVEYIN